MGLGYSFGGITISGNMFSVGPSAIEKLRSSRAPDCKPPKPKPVTDEQLLAIVEQLEERIKLLERRVENEKTDVREWMDRKFRRKWFG